MSERIKNVLIGLFVMAACCLVISLILFLEPDVGDGKKTLHVRFSNIAKINVGTRVLYAGRPVGEVVAIQEIPNARGQPTDPMGRLYFYDLTLKLDSSVVVFKNDDVCIQTAGLLGEKSVAIIPRPSPAGESVHEIISDPIYANTIDPIENAFNQISHVSGQIVSTLQDMNSWLKTYGSDAGRAIQSFSTSMHRIDTALQQMHEQKLFINAGEMITSLKDISQKVSRGDGMLGKMIEDQGLYLKMDAVINKVDTMMNDVNHYGILFHLNKGWQRLRTRRMNAFSTATSPSDVAGFFRSELSELTTSMARLQLASEEMESMDLESWSNDKTFQQNFSDLLERSKTLTESLRLFNQQMQDRKALVKKS
jgi:phospholipid/cholesterol/gamma-HCH transport system substrate-binding protein